MTDAVAIQVIDANGSVFPFSEDYNWIEHDKIIDSFKRGSNHHHPVKTQLIDGGWSATQIGLARVYSQLTKGTYSANVFLRGHSKPLMKQEIDVEKSLEAVVLNLPNFQSAFFKIGNWDSIKVKIAKPEAMSILCEYLDGSGNVVFTDDFSFEEGRFQLFLNLKVKYRIWVVTERPADNQHARGYSYLPMEYSVQDIFPLTQEVTLTSDGDSILKEIPAPN